MVSRLHVFYRRRQKMLLLWSWLSLMMKYKMKVKVPRNMWKTFPKSLKWEEATGGVFLQNSQENTWTRVSFLIKLQPWVLQKKTLKNIFLTQHPRTTTSVKRRSTYTEDISALRQRLKSLLRNTRKILSSEPQ